MLLIFKSFVFVFIVLIYNIGLKAQNSKLAGRVLSLNEPLIGASVSDSLLSKPEVIVFPSVT